MSSSVHDLKRYKLSKQGPSDYDPLVLEIELKAVIRFCENVMGKDATWKILAEEAEMLVKEDIRKT